MKPFDTDPDIELKQYWFITTANTVPAWRQPPATFSKDKKNKKMNQRENDSVLTLIGIVLLIAVISTTAVVAYWNGHLPTLPGLA